jgi:ubiquinone biosynthesis protein
LFVKFGQILSTRRDLLPDDIADELSKLQDAVAPFPGAEAKAIVERAYQRSIGEVFSQFNQVPLASASIAQVHVARLLDDREVVVKVVRPGIENVIRRDVGLLYTVAELVERYWRESHRLRPRAIVSEFEKIIFDELDLQREAASASLLRRNFQHTKLLYVPEIHWDYSHRNVLVAELVSGVPVSDVETLRAADVDLKVLAEKGVDIFFTQVFKHNFFHADMHPGNIFVDITEPQDPSYVAVDFGIMGSLTPDDQRYLAENFLAFFNRDYFRVAELHVISEWVPPDTRVDEFESAIRSVCEPIFERPLKDISFASLLLRLFQTARRFNMEVQPQLVLLQKTLLNIEGLGRQLYPDLDLWQTAKPFLEEWVRDRVGVKATLKELHKQAPRWGEIFPALPAVVYEVLRKANEGKLRVTSNSDELVRLRLEIRRANQRSVMATVGAAFLISSAVLLGLDGYVPTMVSTIFGDAPLMSWVLGLLGLYLVWAGWPGRDH